MGRHSSTHNDHLPIAVFSFLAIGFDLGVFNPCSKGLLFSPDDYGARYYLLPRDDFKDYQPPAQTLPRIPYNAGGDQRQKWEFVQTCKGEYEPGTFADFSFGGHLTKLTLWTNGSNQSLSAGREQPLESFRLKLN